MPNMVKGIIVLFLLMGCVISLYLVSTLEKQLEADRAQQIAIEQAKLNQSFENHALDANQAIAQGGYNAIVAVAVSGDLAQASQARSTSTIMISVAIIFSLFVVYTMFVDSKKTPSK